MRAASGPELAEPCFDLTFGAGLLNFPYGVVNVHMRENPPPVMTLPNQLSALRIALTPIVVACLLLEGRLAHHVAAATFLVASFTDWYDGHFARKYGYVTKWGSYLDPLADKILISGTLAAFCVLEFFPLWMLMAIVCRDVLITGLRTATALMGRQMPTSTVAKWKTFSQVGLAYLVLAVMQLEDLGWAARNSHVFNSSVSLHDLVHNAALLVTAFTLITGALYLLDNRKHVAALARRFYRVFVPSDL